MEKKLIFLDIDGTLTEPGLNVPPASALSAIQKAQTNGHKIILCSGRCYSMLSSLLQYGFDGVIASAGGYIEYGNTVIYDCPMTQEQRNKALSVFKGSGIHYTIESKTGSYADEGLKKFLQERAQAKGNSELLRWREQLEKDLGIRSIVEYDGEPVYKLVFMCLEEQQLQKPRRLLEEEFDFCIQDFDPFGVLNGELINRKFDKGTAVRKLSEYLRIPLENTVAFGDSMNDVQMIEAVGIGVCMDNGSPALKKIADAVCPSVTENGLYEGFRQQRLI